MICNLVERKKESVVSFTKPMGTEIETSKPKLNFFLQYFY